MKKLMLSSLVLSSMFSVANAAKEEVKTEAKSPVAKESSYAIASVGTGYAGLGLSGGYGASLNKIQKNLGWEADFTQMLGNTVGIVSYYGTLIAGYATYSYAYPENDKVEAMVGIGLAYYNIGYNYDLSGTTYNLNAGGVGLAYKASVKYHLQDNLRLTADYQAYFYGIGVQYDF